jgi:hypothetical protein
MTPEEYEIASLRSNMVAHEVLLEWFSDLCFAMTRSSPGEEEWRSALAFKLNEKHEDFLKLTFKDRDPAESDMTAALFQDAYWDAANKILARAGLPPMA